MNTRSTGLAVRAIASTLIENYLFKFSLYIEACLLGAWVISVVLTFIHSTWWLLLTTMLLPFIIVFGLIIVVSFFIYTRLRPRKLNKNESKQINEFVNEFGVKAVAAKGVKKNPVALSGIIAWKYIKGRGKQPITAVIMEPVNDVATLRTKFQDIVKLFT